MGAAPERGILSGEASATSDSLEEALAPSRKGTHLQALRVRATEQDPLEHPSRCPTLCLRVPGFLKQGSKLSETDCLS